MTDKALNMFDSIVELVDSETSETTAPEKTVKPKPQRKNEDAGEGTQPEEKIVRTSRPVSRSTPKAPSSTPSIQPRPEFVRAHSKARVQKSIRFLPPLIAELDEHLRSLEFVGHERSIQDVMNEALELWLDTHARHK